MGNVNMAKALLAAFLAATLAACGGSVYERESGEQQQAETVVVSETSTEDADQGKLGGSDEQGDGAGAESDESAAGSSVTQVSMATDGVIDTADLFTERDLEQVADTSGATQITLTSGQDVEITAEGVYVVSGSATDVTIRVTAADTDKVQIVLDGVTIENADAPCIYVVSADKVFVTTAAGSTNRLEVTGTFSADGETNTDAVIFAKDDLVLNGQGTLQISSTDNGISCKDDLKVTGGTYDIACSGDAIEANDSIRIADGTISISSQKDGLHAENDEDDTVGYIYICGGTLSISAASDGIQATTYLQIDGGDIAVSAGEGLEATYVQINGGNVDVSASDDGINASYKSTAIGDPVIQITGGELSIAMAQGDTDAIDSNGYIYISGGTVDISAQFAFDYMLGAEMTGGTVYVNGEQVTQITESMMMGGPGGGMMGGDPMGGQMGGPGGGQMGGGPGGGM